MRKWQTTVNFRGYKLTSRDAVEETVKVEIETDLPFTSDTSPRFQELVWEQLFRQHPEWCDADHMGSGLAFLPKNSIWVTAPILMLSHEYREV